MSPWTALKRRCWLSSRSVAISTFEFGSTYAYPTYLSGMDGGGGGGGGLGTIGRAGPGLLFTTGGGGGGATLVGSGGRLFRYENRLLFPRSSSLRALSSNSI